MQDGACVTLRGIRKRYNDHTVLEDVSLRVDAGECVCVTGENGCGKSTLLRIIAGLTRPDAGTVRRGRDGSTQYVPDQFPPIAMTGRRFLSYMARVDTVADTQLIAQFHMEAYLDQSIAEYSKGMRSKIGAVQALLARPELLLLDEPVSGQDAQARTTFIAAVRRLMEDGCAVVMACHERELIDVLATRVMRISGGKLLPGDWMDTRTREECLCGECERYKRGDCAGRRDCRA